MQIKTLYKYQRPDGGLTVSLTPPILEDIEYVEIYRLVADKGYVLTDGTITVECIDTTDVELWSEVRPDDDEATTEDYLNALEELGVTDDEESNT